MSVLILAAALAFGQPTPVQIAACAPAQTTPAAAAGRLKPKRPTDLPPGYFMRTVLRRVGDCSVVDVRGDGAWVHRLDGAAPAAPIPAGR